MIFNDASNGIIPVEELPLLDYKFPVDVKKDTGRELLDYGKGHSNGKLYFGRGLKFNGVDQSIELQSADKVGEFTMIATSDTNARYNALSYNVFVYGNTVAFYEVDENGNNIYTTYTLPTTGTIAVVYKNNTISIFLNGKLEKVFDNLYPLNPYGDRAIGVRYSTYSDGIVSNYTYINKALTPDQIAYQYNHPEKFLYSVATTQEDGSKTYSLHSEILTQEEIDSVVAYLPMCETDEYVRDMVGYSEILDFSEEFTGTLGDFYSVSGGVLENLDGDKLKVTSDGSSDFSRAVVDLVGYEIGDKVLVSFDVVSITGSVRFHDYSNNKSYTDLLAPSTYRVVITLGDLDMNLGFGGYSDSIFELIIDNVKVSKLTSTYQITNFTNSSRDEALQLTYGLQTCFLQRDSLGVPSGSSFDRLQWGDLDGKVYYDNNVVLPASYQIEMVISRSTLQGLAKILGGVNQLGAICYTNGYIYIYPYYDDSNYNLHVSVLLSEIDKYYHIVMQVDDDGVTVTSSIYLGGVLKNTKSYDYSSKLNMEFSSVFYQYGTIKEKYSIPLFKIHTTPQDPVELYNEAVRKGLLQ